MSRQPYLLVIAAMLPDAPLMAAYMSLFIIQAAIAAHLMCDPFYSGRQQSLEMLSLTVTLVAYHLGILLKAGGDASQTDGLQFLFSSLQFALNAGVMWRFFSCIFKDMLLAGCLPKTETAQRMCGPCYYPNVRLDHELNTLSLPHGE